MSNLHPRILGTPAEAGTTEKLAAWMRLLGPLFAPLLILVCAPRWEMAATAASWCVLILPGVLAAQVLFPSNHPLGCGVSRLALATVGGLTLFGLSSWAGSLLHWKLSTVLLAYGGLYAAITAVLLTVLLRRGAPSTPRDGLTPEADLSLDAPRWYGALALLGIVVLLAGVAWTAAQGRTAEWWQGTVLAATAALFTSVILLLGLRSRATPAAKPQPSAAPRRSSRSTRTKPEAASPPSGVWLVSLLWLAAAALTWHSMQVSYGLPSESDPNHLHRSAWNSDDVTYVSLAVDYRYGLPLGASEPSLGGGFGLKHNSMSPLIAPLVGAISWVTRVEPAALHHSVLGPLFVLIGVSALAGLLMVLLRMHRWAVPLGLVVALLVLNKSWEYERSYVIFLLSRTTQNKSVHLWILHPLQLAALLLMVFRPNGRHLGLNLAVALVGHLIHPFATILGAMWTGTVCVYAAIGRRRALPMLLIVLAAYAAFGGSTRVLRNRPVDGPSLPGFRVPGSPQRSRDLVRLDDRPIRRHDPQVLFGQNMVFHLAAVATPLALVLVRRRREIFLTGLIGIVVVACCNCVWLGTWVNRALPTSIFWRLRWVMPSLAAAAIIAFVLYWACGLLLRRSDNTLTPTRSFVASLAVVGVFLGFLSQVRAHVMQPGPAPERLSRFSADILGLPDLLGGMEAAPYVWGPRTVTRELPQLMPKVGLVLSREHLVRPCDQANYPRLVLRLRDVFYARAGREGPPDGIVRKALGQLRALYPVDHVVVDYSAGRGDQLARVLLGAGWQNLGRSGVYEVWRAPDS
ncbi:MAG: hypothetical protein GY842_23110 [bacterium]|nr:hypothetical protein [bacterium]